MVPERRYAKWNPRFRGAPTPVGTYYFVTAILVFVAAGLRFLVDFGSLLFIPLNFAGLFLSLYNPIVRRRVEALRDVPAASPQYSVRISLARGTVYGTDEGLVSFVDGWLLFVGAGCAFSFRACDALASPSERTISFSAPSQTHRLLFLYEEKGFEEAWDRWREETPPAQGIAVLPPVLPLPKKREWDHVLTALLLGIGSFLVAFPTRTGSIGVGAAALLFLLGVRKSRRATDEDLARIAWGKPARRSAWTILGSSIILENLGVVVRADLRRRRRRRALVRRPRTP